MMFPVQIRVQAASESLRGHAPGLVNSRLTLVQCQQIIRRVLLLIKKPPLHVTLACVFFSHNPGIRIIQPNPSKPHPSRPARALEVVSRSFVSLSLSVSDGIIGILQLILIRLAPALIRESLF
jgi:hypothetical protein